MRRERATGSSATPNGKKRLAGDTAREATSDEVKGLRKEAVSCGNSDPPSLTPGGPLRLISAGNNPGHPGWTIR